ncbi:MAG: DUF1579 family protein [Gemmataceae bacterium]
MKAFRIAVFCALLSVTASGGQPPGDKKNDPQEKIEPRKSPGVGQKYLARFVGEWTVEKEFYSRQAGAAPTKTKGVVVQEMIHEGRFLRSEFTFESPTGKSTGTGLIGFEPDTGLFTSTWIDSRQTKMSCRQSKEPFDGKQIVLHGVNFEGEKAGRKSKTVSTIDADGRTFYHRQYGYNEDGTERLVMQMKMTKKEPATK